MANEDTITTLDVSSLTNSIVMAIDKEFRKNNIPFAHRHTEFRPLIEGMVTSVVVDQVTEDVTQEVTSNLAEALQGVIAAAVEQRVTGGVNTVPPRARRPRKSSKSKAA